MKVEIDEGRKLVIVWLCSDEDKSLAQPMSPSRKKGHENSRKNRMNL